MQDWLNKVNRKVINLSLSVSAFINSLIYINFYRLIGIKLGVRNIFYGKPKFVRHHRSHITVGDDCRFRSHRYSNLIGVNHPCIIATHSSHAKLIIGNACGFSGTTIGCFSQITLGNNVRCGANTLITDSDWHQDDSRVSGPKPVIIEDNVWLGYGVLVMKGVNIGTNSIIGAGSIVVSDIPANVIAAGNPCKVIRELKS